MPFHPGQPTINYLYGCRVVEGREVLDEQILAAHKYRNALVALERERREKVEQLLSEIAPDLTHLSEQVEAAEQEAGAAAEQIRAWRAQHKKMRAPEPMRKRLAVAKEAKKSVYAERKQRRSELFGSLAFQAAQASVEQWSKDSLRALRKNSGVYWGTYLRVEAGMQGARSGAPPDFRALPAADKVAYRLTGGTSPATIDGQIAVQIQGGMTPDEAIAGTDNRLSITPHGTCRHVWLVRLQLAAGVQVALGAKFHRPLPDGCRIKQVLVNRRTVGTQVKWSIMFSCARESGWKKDDCATSGRVAVNIGWRAKPDGSLRALRWVDEDGQEGELLLPASLLARRQKVTDIQSIRSQELDRIKLVFGAWLKDHSPPDWLADEVSHLSSWRSPNRLDALVRYWRRFDGDDTILAELVAWRKQDRHLRNWQDNEQQSIGNARKDIYRCFAAAMRKQYKTVVLAKVQWKKMLHRPDEADTTDEMRFARSRSRIVSPGTLETALTSVFAESVTLPAVHLTALCSYCGQHSGEAHPESLYHTCTHCGTTYDQDINHCRNLLSERLGAPDENSGDYGGNDDGRDGPLANGGLEPVEVST